MSFNRMENGISQLFARYHVTNAFFFTNRQISMVYNLVFIEACVSSWMKPHEAEQKEIANTLILVSVAFDKTLHVHKKV